MITTNRSLLDHNIHSPKERVRWRSELVLPLLCSLALLACIFIANPFVGNSPYHDDWSYSDVALKFAQTGQIHYNGWGSPTLLFQCAWAALFIRAFGFSFNLLRFIALPFSVGFVCLIYFLGRQLGLRRSFAVFATLIVVLSPLFLPLSASFMTEPYALFFTLLCIYAAIRIAERSGNSSGVGWLWLLAVAGILGGSDRQTIWPLPLLLVPYLAWLRRSRKVFLLNSGIAYALCLGCLGFVLTHFKTGYAAWDYSPRKLATIAFWQLPEAFHFILSLLLLSILLCSPALLCALPVLRRNVSRRTLLGMVALCLILIEYLYTGVGRVLGIVPFLGDTITPYGILDRDVGLGTRPHLLHMYLRIPLTFSLILLIALMIHLYRRRTLRLELPTPTAAIFVIFFVPYLCLCVPGAILRFCFDRYALPFLPLLAICILLSMQPLLTRIPRIAWACLGVFALYAICTTHDYDRYLHARATVAEEISTYGIPRLHLTAGFEQDGWTQIQTTHKIGHVVYHTMYGEKYNRPWFMYFDTAIQPDYVSFSSALNNVPSRAVFTVPFDTWLPPSKQAVSVLKKTDVPKLSPD